MSISDAAIQRVVKVINKRRPVKVVFDVEMIDEVTPEMIAAAEADQRLHPLDRRYYLITGDEDE